MTDIHIFKSSPDAVEVAAGETLFSEGEDGDVMFAVVEGEVELIHQGRVMARRLRRANVTADR